MEHAYERVGEDVGARGGVAYDVDGVEGFP